MCTDGSTYSGTLSGAAYVFVEDNARKCELWGMHGAYWKIGFSDNYLAEMSAINKCIRSIPISASITVHTDSEASIKAIKKGLSNPLEYTSIRSAGRP